MPPDSGGRCLAVWIVDGTPHHLPGNGTQMREFSVDCRIPG